jgi:hypothetical protein
LIETGLSIGIAIPLSGISNPVIPRKNFPSPFGEDLEYGCSFTFKLFAVPTFISDSATFFRKISIEAAEMTENDELGNQTTGCYQQ